ncbi:uncharacterized protein LDX57_011266 [Aspergillus melleus]|uniref:uncharacterized protein n=1 Tax=Aspergillus melleus TaxID=138277 RepID=UPI001E8E8E61|nr:uncharacterized protein LDX57_011266 [Aspergillus melleus]KAH8433632.1 hypothetical protein LDX57_011266 [Aspergillus melleus]
MTTEAPTTKRLHITPFTPELLPSVLGASIRPLATEVSFHSIPTYPENNYGYVTLPAMEADKVKKKLNGSILKGRKFNVEEARSHKRSRDETEADSPASDRKSTSDKKQKKKRKSEDNVLDGYELPSDRKVKRGWTESTQHKSERRKDEKKKGKDGKSSKSQAKSKYTEKSECLFRTNIPPNRQSPVEEKQEKQSKKKKKSAQDSVVHEFAKTVTYPSFLRSAGDEAAPTSSFVEGKGWVDESGNIKEQVSDRIRKAEYKPGQVDGAKQKGRSKTSPASRESKSKKAPPKNDASDESEDWTSSSGDTSSDDESISSSSSDSESSSSGDEIDAHTKPETSAETHNDGPADSDAKVDGGQTSAKMTEESLTQEVHPLEALFKRPAPGSAEPKPQPEPTAQFSFFGQDDIESEEETEEPAAPQTPFTKNDLQSRGLRSAAPTPDTALFNRAVNWNRDQVEPMDTDDEPYTTTTPVPKAGAGSKEESDFTKWFWENRGDNNRAWKKRRRDVAKEQRQRENRKKGMRGKS